MPVKCESNVIFRPVIHTCTCGLRMKRRRRKKLWHWLYTETGETYATGSSHTNVCVNENRMMG